MQNPAEEMRRSGLSTQDYGYGAATSKDNHQGQQQGWDSLCRHVVAGSRVTPYLAYSRLKEHERDENAPQQPNTL